MFLAKEPVGDEALVDLLISVRPKQVIEARGRVVYETRRAANDFEVGVEFLSISEQDRRVLESIFDDHQGDPA
jgi:c-di-GMP-binding flagellar brake protein YcgR